MCSKTKSQTIKEVKEKKNKIKIFLFSFITTLIILFALPNILSSGLIINQTTQSLVKISGTSPTYNFTIINPTTYTFYNITLEPNVYLNTPTIPELNTSQIASISSVVVANESFNKTFKVQGYYYTTVGVSNNTHVVNVDYYNGLDKCDFTITKGDRVLWVNSVSDEIQLKNVATGNVVTIIPQGNNYTTYFDSPQSFQYVFLRRGFIFTRICTITALSDSGLVNNPEYDGFMNLTVTLIFNPTNITYNIVSNNYTINVFQSQDGVMTITNVGNESAKNIMLTGDWLTFNTNNFNLLPGETKGIIYTIKPSITLTSQTNQSYNKTLSIAGNFNTLYYPFNIFVPYANMDANQSGNYQSLLELIRKFCKDNPKETFCLDKPSVVYIGNGTDQNFNVSYSTEQVKAIYSYIFSMGDDQKIVNNYMKETLENISNRINGIENLSANSLKLVSDSEVKRQENSGNTTFIIIIFIMLGLLGLLIMIILVMRRYREQEKITKW